MYKTLFLNLCVLATLFLYTHCETATKAEQKRHSKKSNAIAIQPFIGTTQEKITFIQQVITTFYHLETIVLPSIEPPSMAYTTLKTPRYRADSLLLFLWRNCPDSINHIMGIAQFDISITKRDSLGEIKKPIDKYTDFGVYGLGYCPGKSCIISSYRLQTNDKRQTQERIKKVVLHELGHTFGLPHCANTHCFMQDAKESIKTIDNEKSELCINCQLKLVENKATN